MVRDVNISFAIYHGKINNNVGLLGEDNMNYSRFFLVILGSFLVILMSFLVSHVNVSLDITMEK